MGRLVAQSWDLGSRLVFKRSRVRIPELKTRWKIIAIVKKVKRKDNYIRRDQIIFFWFVNSDQMPGLFVQYLAIYDIEKLPKSNKSKVGSKLCKLLNKPSNDCQRVLKIRHNVEFLPNLVTMSPIKMFPFCHRAPSQQSGERSPTRARAPSWSTWPT